jgi:chromate transporter
VTPEKRTALRQLLSLFFRLGLTAFGGPVAHIAMMQDEVVRRRQWLGEERFLDLVSATNLIPGPNSTELAIHIGRERAGGLGLLVAGLSFILPAMLLSAALGWVYVRFGALPQATWLLYGIKPVILAVVVQALWRLLPTAARTNLLRVIGGLCVVAAALGVHELAVLFSAGAVVAIARWRPKAKPDGALEQPGWALPLVAAPVLSGEGAGAGTGTVSLTGLFFVFCKTGAVLFGSGYVLLAFLRADLVERLHWITEAQLIDAVAVGQLTPGPVFTTATFIGYLLAGPRGALVATAGIFLPAFFFVALSGPLIPRLRASPIAGAFLDGVNVASLALMAVVTAQLGRSAIVDLPTLALGLISALLFLRYKLNATWLIAGGAAAGFLLHFFVGRAF